MLSPARVPGTRAAPCALLALLAVALLARTAGADEYYVHATLLDHGCRIPRYYRAGLIDGADVECYPSTRWVKLDVPSTADPKSKCNELKQNDKEFSCQIDLPGSNSQRRFRYTLDCDNIKSDQFFKISGQTIVYKRVTRSNTLLPVNELVDPLHNPENALETALLNAIEKWKTYPIKGDGMCTELSPGIYYRFKTSFDAELPIIRASYYEIELFLGNPSNGNCDTIQTKALIRTVSQERVPDDWLFNPPVANNEKSYYVSIKDIVGENSEQLLLQCKTHFVKESQLERTAFTGDDGYNGQDNDVTKCTDAVKRPYDGAEFVLSGWRRLLLPQAAEAFLPPTSTDHMSCGLEFTKLESVPLQGPPTFLFGTIYTSCAPAGGPPYTVSGTQYETSEPVWAYRLLESQAVEEEKQCGKLTSGSDEIFYTTHSPLHVGRPAIELYSGSTCHPSTLVANIIPNFIDGECATPPPGQLQKRFYDALKPITTTTSSTTTSSTTPTTSTATTTSSTTTSSTTPTTSTAATTSSTTPSNTSTTTTAAAPATSLAPALQSSIVNVSDGARKSVGSAVVVLGVMGSTGMAPLGSAGALSAQSMFVLGQSRCSSSINEEEDEEIPSVLGPLAPLAPSRTYAGGVWGGLILVAASVALTPFAVVAVYLFLAAKAWYTGRPEQRGANHWARAMSVTGAPSLIYVAWIFSYSVFLSCGPECLRRGEYVAGALAMAMVGLPFLFIPAVICLYGSAQYREVLVRGVDIEARAGAVAGGDAGGEACEVPTFGAGGGPGEDTSPPADVEGKDVSSPALAKYSDRYNTGDVQSEAPEKLAGVGPRADAPLLKRVLRRLFIPRCEYNDEIPATAMLASCVTTSRSASVPLLLLVPYVGHLAILPVIAASSSGLPSSCVPGYGLAAGAHFLAGTLVVLFNPTDILFQDIIGGLALAITGALIVIDLVRLEGADVPGAYAEGLMVAQLVLLVMATVDSLVRIVLAHCDAAGGPVARLFSGDPDMKSMDELFVAGQDKFRKTKNGYFPAFLCCFLISKAEFHGVAQSEEV